MPKRTGNITVPSLGELDRSSGSIGRSLAQRLRTAIAEGHLKPGERLPSTRTMASSLGVARGTVVEVFDQLSAEGYLESKIGAGTRVAAMLGNEPSPLPANHSTTSGAYRLPRSAARLAAALQALNPTPHIPFSIAVPEGGIEPDDNWRRLGNRVRTFKRAQPTGYGNAFGVQELRVAIADHARRARAVRCEPEQVIITSGTQQGLYMAGRVLLERGDTAMVEDPAYSGLTAVLDDLEIQMNPVPVDAQGLDVDYGLTLSPNASAAFVTPSHQYPLGMPLSMNRRNALLGWAERNQTWIVEDDYDSELRYAGHPFPSMQGLNSLRVVYLGTFSKVLFPSLRLGYVIAPSPLVDAFGGARAILDRHSPTADQYVLAAYMQGGFYEAHIRRIRGIYAERRSILLSAIEESLSSEFVVEPRDQGMHVLLWLPKRLDDVSIARRAQETGLSVRPISPMYATQPRSGLMLGFGSFSPEVLRCSVKALARIMEPGHDRSS